VWQSAIWCVPKFKINGPYYSACFSETSVHIYHTTWHQILENIIFILTTVIVSNLPYSVQVSVHALMLDIAQVLLQLNKDKLQFHL